MAVRVRLALKRRIHREVHRETLSGTIRFQGKASHLTEFLEFFLKIMSSRRNQNYWHVPDLYLHFRKISTKPFLLGFQWIGEVDHLFLHERGHYGVDIILQKIGEPIFGIVKNGVSFSQKWSIAWWSFKFSKNHAAMEFRKLSAKAPKLYFWILFRLWYFKKRHFAQLM